MHAAEGVGTGRMAHPPLLCEVWRSCPELWVFDFTCELYQPGRETSALCSGDDTRHSMEASGFILEQIIDVHGYTCLSSYPCALIGEVKVGVCGVTWCHCVQQGTTCGSWAPWEVLGASWDPAGFVPHSRRSHRSGLLFEDRTCKEEDVLISSLVLEVQMKVKLCLSQL